ncbi:MAG TPA: response regulator [Solirubrobacteraceae bacterium]|nr:response regulator [Solirubrobacteraceae bacterium]
MLVLIAEDDAIARQVLEMRVKQLDHDTVLASDGADAWDRFQDVHPDVVITDWSMPHLSGIDLCRKIRAHAGDGYTYVIAVTAKREHRYALEAMRAGLDDYLTKPVDPEELELRLLAAERLKASYAEMRASQRRAAPRSSEPTPDGRRRVLVADDDPVVRAMFAGLIEADPTLALVGIVEDAEQAVELAKRELPDVAILDWIMPGGGDRAASQIHQHSPMTAIVGMSASNEPAASFDMLRAGARDFIRKGSTTDEVLQLLQHVGRAP